MSRPLVRSGQWSQTTTGITQPAARLSQSCPTLAHSSTSRSAISAQRCKISKMPVAYFFAPSQCLMQTRHASAHALQAASAEACFSHSDKHLRQASRHLVMIAGVQVSDSQLRAQLIHSRLQVTQARRQAKREGSFDIATAHASMQSKQESAHVQQTLSECFSTFTTGA